MKHHVPDVLKNKAGRLKHIIIPHKVGKWQTICEVHRSLWRLTEEKIRPNNPEVADEIEILILRAYDYGKRMSDRLFYYNGLRGEEMEEDFAFKDETHEEE